MPATIRQAGPADLEQMPAAYEWLFEEPGRRPAGWDPDLARERLGRLVESERSTAFIAVQALDGTIAGICTAYLDLVSVRYGSRCWVEDLAVAPEVRSGGIGGDLLDAAAAWARGLGATHLELDTGVARVDSRRFYEARDPQAQSISYQWSLEP